MDGEATDIPFPDTDPSEVARANRDAARWQQKRGFRVARSQARSPREEDKRGRKARYGEPPSWRSVQALAARALANGAKWLKPGHLEWDLAKHCSRAYERTVGAGPYSRGEARQAEGTGALASAHMSVTYRTPCRACVSCLEHRRRLWTARARYELRHSPDTLFGTLTFTKAWQDRWMQACRDAAREDGVDFDGLSAETQFARRVAHAGRIATKFIDIIRLYSPAPVIEGKRVPNLRYMLVAEPHKGGQPHFHMLLHSIYADYPQASVKMLVRSTGREVDTWPFLETKWAPYGFSAWRRVTEKSAGYISKYLSKDSSARVRASEEYGAFEYEVRHALLVHSMRRESSMRDLSKPRPSNDFQQQIIPSPDRGGVGEGNVNSNEKEVV